MIVSTPENIFDSNADVLVNPVNCVGVMGAGLAKQFKYKYPRNYKEYRNACKQGGIGLGHVFCVAEDVNGPIIANFPTKFHWINPSRIENIRAGLISLSEFIYSEGMRSVSIPKIGCGLGGLDWSDVRQMIMDVFIPAIDSSVVVYLHE